MASLKQEFDAGQTQGKTEEIANSIKGSANEAKEKACGAAHSATEKASDTAQSAKEVACDSAHSAGESAQHGKDQTSGFLQQTGEKVTSMAAGAVETVKSTLGVDSK